MGLKIFFIIINSINILLIEETCLKILYNKKNFVYNKTNKEYQNKNRKTNLKNDFF